MTTLATNHRNKLERVITEAREAAETGAKAALEAFAVHHHEPYSHMTSDDRKLRNRLRAHSRQLGDHYDSKKGTQAIDHLVNECAYEHWHRMLFARFLAENDLLIEPEMGVAISLEECEDLAKEQKIDPWMLASRYAQQMLPQIFRPDDPVLQVIFAREHLLKLERLLESLEPEVFTASDAIGWVYQFWQSKKKDEVNRSGKKIGADELPAVTQLFTEPYMVSFLIHNTLGAWYAGKVLAENPELARNAENEEALRNALALPGVTWDYLRFIRSSPSPSTGEGWGGGDDIWQPAAGTFDGWPKRAAELKVLDPCCGSGHFLVAVFLCLVALRMKEEGLSAKEACDTVLQNNIFGLEIDERCTQIAAFALALAAWKYPSTFGYRKLPELNIACAGIGPQATEEQWLKLAEKFGMPTQMDEQERVKNGLRNLHRLFSQAPTLGSLIDPKQLEAGVFVAHYETIQPYLTAVLNAEKSDDEMHEYAIAAAGMVKAADLLVGKYTLVITNVPYLASGKQSNILRAFIDSRYRESKTDLGTVFVERSLDLASRRGTAAIVVLQSWLYLPTYKRMRSSLLNKVQWDMIARLGPGAFGTISGEVVNVCLFMSSTAAPHDDLLIPAIDVSACTTLQEKAGGLREASLRLVMQKAQLKNPDHRFIDSSGSAKNLLQNFADGFKGLSTGDLSRFIHDYWELSQIRNGWVSLQGSTNVTGSYMGRHLILKWDDGRGPMVQSPACYVKGKSAWGKQGISIGQTTLKATLYTGDMFDENAAAIVVNKQKDIPAIWAYCSSNEFAEAIRCVDRALKVTNKTFVKVPFDILKWQEESKRQYPKGLPKPYSNDPTQWIFHGHPCGSVVWDENNKWTVCAPLRGDDTVLHVAIARLLGYRWPAELDPEMELADEQRQWLKKCESLLRFADDDGVVCIPSIRGEDAAAERLRELLVAAYGSDWSPAKERELVAAAQAQDLDDWLRNSFFEQHCQLFHHRPFVWHIWDGRKRDGFHALVNYHKLAEAGGKGRQLLEKLTYGYLGDWITLQKDGVKQGIGGADDRLTAALELEKRLKAILEGEPPFDIFVRWKPIEQQPVGWEPDINDGVRLNIRPFMADDIPDGKRGAGILRWKPNIKWDKDRGKDVASAPWFDLGPQYGGYPGDRINDHHLTCEEKRKAREAMEKTKEKKA